MSFLPKIGLLALALTVAGPAAVRAQQTAKYKCMIQMTNYMGEEAYVVISLINPKGAYEKTLYVLGSNKKWYPDLKEWHKALARKSPAVSAITGASVGGGDRAVTVIDLDPAKIDKDYKIRFESAVEDNKYYVKDLEIPLTTEALSAKNEGAGYIRYVRFSPSGAN